MAGQQLQANHQRKEQYVKKAPPLQDAIDEPKQQRQPSAYVDEIGRHGPYDHVSAQGIAKPGAQRGRPHSTKGAHQRVHARTRQPQVQDNVPVQRSPRGQEQRQNHIGRIQHPGLTLSKQGEAAVDGRIPQRQLALAEGAGEEVAERVVLHHHVLHEKRPF